MNKLRILIFTFFGILGILLILHRLFPNEKEGRSLITNVYSSNFSGTVNFIDAGLGLKVGIKNSSVCYDLSGAYNDISSFGPSITWGDIISKNANTDTIILKSKSNGKVTIWMLPVKNN